MLFDSLLQVAAGAVCSMIGGPAAGAACASAASAFVAGVASGKLGVALKAWLISAITATALAVVGDLTAHGQIPFGTSLHLANAAGHAAVGCRIRAREWI